MQTHPSILSADFANLERQLLILEEVGFQAIHCDIMDGHFVPNLTFGAPILKSLKTNLKMDCHLMVQNPEIFVDQFKTLNLDCVTFHIESTPNAHRLAQYIKTFGCKVGVSLNPATHENTVEHLLPIVDLVFVMTVNPGFGGQAFIEPQLAKIQAISNMIEKSKRQIVLQVDGGITEKTAPLVKKMGANCLVSGSYIFDAFQHNNPKEELLRRKKMLEV